MDAVKNRYAQAAHKREEALCCPVDYDPKYLKIIPDEVIERDYGCGDPSAYVREGDTVVLAYGAANRDARKFPDADTYDIDRNPRGHLGFGTGKHFCIGNTFARMVARIATERLLEEVPDFDLVHRDFGWVPSSNFRSPVSLPLRRV